MKRKTTISTDWLAVFCNETFAVLRTPAGTRRSLSQWRFSSVFRSPWPIQRLSGAKLPPFWWPLGKTCMCWSNGCTCWSCW